MQVTKLDLSGAINQKHLQALKPADASALTNENQNMINSSLGQLGSGGVIRNGRREQCYNNYNRGCTDFDDGLEEASHQLTLEDFAPNFLQKSGVGINSDRSKNQASEGTMPASAINDSGSENRLSELVRLVDKRKRMILERERN